MCVGEMPRLVDVKDPSALAEPKHCTAPVVRTTHVCWAPQPTVLTDAPLRFTNGRLSPTVPAVVPRGLVSPCPSWPFVLIPKQRSPPLSSTTHMCEFPAEIRVAVRPVPS